MLPKEPGLIHGRLRSLLTPGRLPLVNSTPARLDLMWNYAVASTFKSRRLHPGAPTKQSAPSPAPLPASRAFLCGKSANAALFSSSTLMPIWNSGSTKLNTVVSAASNARRLRSATLFRGHQVVLNPRHAAHVVETMRGLMQTTKRIGRGWLDRLKGYVRLYETKVTDGDRVASGRGSTSEVSQSDRRKEIGTPILVRSPKANLLCAALPQCHLMLPRFDTLLGCLS